jgi:glutamate N-acetyltransferase/amino-acid N-acetyltransferase
MRFLQTNLMNPQGYLTCTRSLGVKNSTKDFLCIISDRECNSAAVFTQSLFAGPSIKISKKHHALTSARGIVAISKNANVATGVDGEEDAYRIIEEISRRTGLPSEKFLIASTGVIGRRYPIDKMIAQLHGIEQELESANFVAAAEAIMTTDTVPKYVSAKVGDAVIAGIAKGVGMIEPNMATLLAFMMTDAQIQSAELDAIFRRVVETSFNCLSVDTDTSTSDMAVILANGAAGAVNLADFEAALAEVATALVKAIARDGEGATKLIEVTVSNAETDEQAKTIAKSIVNSPLVKTAVHGADPNWGRVLMAIGKCSQYTSLQPEKIHVYFGDHEVYPALLDGENLKSIAQYLRSDTVAIRVSLNAGNCVSTVWGCDLSAGYVKINADYTT